MRGRKNNVWVHPFELNPDSWNNPEKDVPEPELIIEFVVNINGLFYEFVGEYWNCEYCGYLCAELEFPQYFKKESVVAWRYKTISCKNGIVIKQGVIKLMKERDYGI